ncbi:SpoIIE family protein phosphatase [Streptomyces silvisoli]|uniref:SpoIIE family protein phosphatase n=1 Tax=Streptomyces silvisoli TaxID=3034235 RepID=UPI0023E27F86|nr:SpoIIE family protein phosphatase [Streptomyces silvisoli]
MLVVSGLAISQARTHAAQERDEAIMAATPGQLRCSHEEQAILDWLFSQSPIAVAVFDADLRCIRQNTAMGRLLGAPPTDGQAHRLSRLAYGPDPAVWERCVRQVLATGEPAVVDEIRGRSAADPDHDRIFATTAAPLHDQQGQVFGVCTTVDDITEQHRAQERLAMINEASSRIGSTLDLMRTAQELADTAVPRLCDWVTVDLLDTVLRGDEPGPFTRTVALRRMANRSVLAGEPEAVRKPGEVDYYPAQSPPVRSMATGKPAVLRTPDPVVQAWLAMDPARAARFQAFKFQSLMPVPISARGAILGVTVFFRRSADAFTDDDRLLAQELVAIAALCLDNARRFSRERTAALALQHSLLSQRLPAQAAVDVAARYRPAGGRSGAGGDWFDVIPLSGARVALVVGDVVGHGITAAAAMGRLRTAVRTLADVDLPPDELLTHLDDLVTRLATEDDGQAEAAEQGATCTYAVYDPVSRRCSIARAGHPPPAVLAPDGTVEFPELPLGPPLGLGNLPFEAAEVELAEGSVLALYTDGLIASRDRDVDEGLRRLRRALARPTLSARALCESVFEEVLPERPSDDATLLIGRTKALAADRVAGLGIPADPAAVADARAWTARRLASWGLHEAAFTTELVVSELVTNAIRHAQPPIELRLIRDETLICEVSDSSNTAPHMRRARSFDEGGRGLLLVSQLTQRWGTRHARDGKTIWCEQPIASEAP